MRLQGYNYSQPGAYFVTICTHGRECALAEIVNDKAVLSEEGQVALDCWKGLSKHYQQIELDEFVIMPNHVHGIIVIRDSDNAGGSRPRRAGLKPAPTRRHSLSEMIRGFKTFSARRINQLKNQKGRPVWQRNYYEHVIRDEKTLVAVREYIMNNPGKWSEDQENPSNRSKDVR